jgi:CheY-like chemotaxis protein
MERVLWVDDDPNFLFLATRTLEKRFALETSTRAEEALQWIADGRSFGVIISDMRMPGMDGRAFLRRLNELGIPVATRLSRFSRATKPPAVARSGCFAPPDGARPLAAWSGGADILRQG